MVYASSVPPYLDPPPNWNQQQQQQQHQQQQQLQYHQQQAHHHQQAGAGIGAGITATGGVAAEPHLHQQPLNQPLASLPDVTNSGGGAAMGAAASSSSVRPGSMADRARQAKLPMPEQALRCPRCDSTNTKFCYFNNYSLSQPRHFCKTCRRYWTRGGALRNVPVGGGCRRNKRTKSSSGGGSSSAKSSAASTSGASGVLLASVAAAAAAAGAGGGANAITASLAGGMQLPSPHLPFLGSLQSLDYGAGASTNMGLNYGGIQSIEPVLDYQQVGSSSSSRIGSLEHWRQQLQHAQQQQQFPLFGGVLEPAASVPSTLGLLTPFDSTQGVRDPGAPAALILNSSGRIHSKASGASASAGLITQLASVKMEENLHQQGLGSLARQYLGINLNPTAVAAASGSTTSEQYWVGGGGDGSGGGNGGGSTPTAGWTNLSGFNSSSTGNL